MFGRLVTIRLKVDSAEEFVRINNEKIIPRLRQLAGFQDESLYIASFGSVAIVKTTWTTRAAAESYERLCHAEILTALAKVIEGRPWMEGFEFSSEPSQTTFAKAA